MKTKFSGMLTLLLALVVQLAFAQEKTISGTVSDDSGLPLPGATVLVKGTSSGTSSDFDGKYSIRASQGATLVFSFVGYTTIEATVGATNTVNVTLQEDTEALEEVVVTALGIKRERKSLGSAITTLDSEAVNKGAQTNISDAIKGKVAGVVISNASTDPGASSGVIIRGFSSLSASNQPLYIIDGVPINNNSRSSQENSNSAVDGLNRTYDFGNGASDINPENIESISILKGASSTALYGSRAANGVIIITTKRGNKDKLSIDFTTQATFSDLLRAPNYQKQFGQGWDGQHFLGENGSWGPRFNDEILVWGNVVNNAQKIKRYSFQEDQWKNFFDIGTAYNTNLAISGGSGNTTGRVAFNNTTADGIFPTSNDSNERNTVTVAFNSEIDFLTFGGTLNYIATQGKGIQGGQGVSVINNLMQIPTDFNINEFKDYKNDPFNNIDNYYTPFGITNPYFTLNEDGARYNKERVFGSFDVNAKITDWVSLTYRLGIDQSSDYTRLWNAIIDATPGSPNDGTTTEQPGFYGEYQNSVKQINHDLLLNFNFDIDEKINVSSAFGFNYNDRYNTSNSASVASQDIPDFFSLSNSASPVNAVSSISKRRLYGIFNSSTFSFNNMLFITANVRNDWYSTLPKENRSVLYGGVNASWLLTETFPGIKNVLSYGKIRAGYGETGVDTDPYQIDPVNIAGNIDNQGFRDLVFPVGGVNAFEVGNRAGNPDLKPERRKELEIGAELSFLKNRISIDFAYYDATVEDQILSLPLASTSGFTNQTANIGTISNKGYEALVTLGLFRNSQGFNWDMIFNYATNDAILEELDPRVEQIALGGLSTISLVARQGEPLALIEGSVPLRDPNGNIVVDGDGVPIASPEKEVYGDTQYDYTLGITNNFSYKGFSFGFTFDIRQGGLMFSRTASNSRFTGNSITTTINDRNPYIVPGSVQSVVDPSDPNSTIFVENTTAIDIEHWDDYYRATANERGDVIDKSFVKLREVTLGYNFSKKLIEKTPFESLSISLIGRNLLLFTPESNQYIDPEVSTFGTDLESLFGEFSANPSTRSASVVLRAKF
ncbi:SusC/RagA family TonB-linked outer membrane protein [Flavivirga sp. 57AJ16]|uniref:SusC/RagA family TonB-linked outer membrane protein n=1 Tax=Flavivirga sp. 57AJ16 TaxID=3025307 RepID=UPI0023663462|nr:SusC/RagA family TonB-linked outer membrane protein [Flavivirga sp. 57AJ16]MDD7886428.1 SusC/RagA family TonB-linked outer membrane protein [Flavivirga sp. 57AJ16]